LEEELVFFILQVVMPEHELRSIFTRGSIRGWVYVEATMNNQLLHLLKRAPGVVRLKTGIIQHQIDFKDWVKMLTMKDEKKDVAIGQWVRVCKGTYKGDVGYVDSIENWGGVSLLLVPRLPLPRGPDSLQSKRKRSTTRTEPALFDPATITRVYGTEPKKLGDAYDFRGSMFEHGLILKAFDIHSFSSTSVYMPTYLFSLFQQSQHPAILASSFPRPLEWNLEEGEQVIVLSTAQRGVIKSTRTNFAEVDLASGEGVIDVPWLDIRKRIVEGDFVEVTSGLLQGQTGWVQRVEHETVHIIEDLTTEKRNNPAILSNAKVSSTSTPAAGN
jgi:transcription elongation factor